MHVWYGKPSQERTCTGPTFLPGRERMLMRWSVETTSSPASKCFERPPGSQYPHAALPEDHDRDLRAILLVLALYVPCSIVYKEIAVRLYIYEMTCLSSWQHSFHTCQKQLRLEHSRYFFLLTCQTAGLCYQYLNGSCQYIHHFLISVTCRRSALACSTWASSSLALCKTSLTLFSTSAFTWTMLFC